MTEEEQLALITEWGSPGHHDRLFTRCSDRIESERLNEDQTIYLRAELGIPDAFSLEAVEYDLGQARADRAGVTYGIYGTRIIDRFIPGPRIQVAGSGDEIVELLGDTDMSLRIVPSSLFLNEDGRLTVYPGPPEALGLDLDAMRSAGRISTFELLAFSERIHREGTTVFAERRWHPSTGITESLRWSHRPAYLQPIAQAYQDFTLFEDLTSIPLRSRGQPEHFTEANEPEFFESLKKAAHAAVRADNRVNYSTLATHGLASRPTVKKAIERLGYDLEVIYAEAVRCTQRTNICTFLWRDRAKFKKKRP